MAGRLSDTVGRKNMYMFGCVFMGVYGFVYFALLDTMVPTLIFIAVATSLIPVMTMYGPEAALIAEAFSPRLRYSGASLGYQLASIIAGGPSPFIATWLLRDVSLDVADRALHPGLRDHRHYRDGAADGLYQQGDLGRIRGCVTALRQPGTLAGARLSPGEQERGFLPCMTSTS